MSLHLDNLVATGQLHRQRADAREFAGLVHSGTTRLVDARRSSLSIESRFDLGYNAAHALSLAALRRLGYRAANRHIVFKVLPETLGLGAEVWRVLDRCHTLRNRGEYEGMLDLDERLVADLIAACERVQQSLAALPPPP